MLSTTSGYGKSSRHATSHIIYEWISMRFDIPTSARRHPTAIGDVRRFKRFEFFTLACDEV